MGEGKQGAMVVEMPNGSSQNPIAQLQNKFKELETGFKVWLSKQSLPVEAAVVTATSGLQGAAIGGFMGTLTQDVSSSLPTPPPATPTPKRWPLFNKPRLLQEVPGSGPIRGKEDVQSSMAAAFGSGALFSLVSGMGGPNPVPNALTSGIFFALVQGGLFELGRKFSQPPAEDTHSYQNDHCCQASACKIMKRISKKGC
ncbi:hypothetical protein HAX54_050420 [Datura stramonium]|uniref:Uncharacterized protein n=1 Tax=Datura stramonium TaxID=4076 RepID=A0ABS8SX86_DATST|nr:hypothetical protein [Datura stramonium]